MMKITQRDFAGNADWEAMKALAWVYKEDNFHVVDLPYRFSSWAFDNPANAKLWHNQQGNLVSWAVMQSPFWTIDFVVHPDADVIVLRQMLDWANQRTNELVNSAFGRPAWFINVFKTQMEHIREVEAAGFASVEKAPVDPWSKVLMRCDLMSERYSPVAPENFHIRPLKGDVEVEAYVELHRSVFESKSMTVDWRRRTLNRNEYIPEIDLVAVNAVGQLAGFCICWLGAHAGESFLGQVEPMGIHSDYRGLGLGKALLEEGLHRLQNHGAEQVLVETDSYRDAAFNLYESVGFRVAQEVLVFRKDV